MKSWKLALAVGLLSLGSAAQAALIDRGNGLIYDDVLDITWTQDADLWGQFGNWQQAVGWADQLDFGGFDDWRLASMSVAAGLPTGATDNPFNCATATEAQCRDNELGYMFYQNLGGMLGDNLTGDQGLFTDIQPVYWSGTEFASDPFDAWGFFYDVGFQVSGGKGFDSIAAWAVRAGDVAAAPLPGTVVLLALGLLGLGAGRQKRRAT